MDYTTAKKCINDIILNCPENTTQINIGFIGGAPLFLIRQIYEYVETLEIKFPYRFFATTNGTCLTEESKKWFSARKEKFILGLSLDGNRTTHNYNCSDSFDLIDIDFFLKTWPLQGVKMILSKFSLKSLADDIIFLHNRGFKTMKGVNLFEGNFDWSKNEFIQILIPQLKKLEEYYIKNPEIPLNQVLDKRLHMSNLSTCSGANFLVKKRFDERIRSKYKIQKLIALFSADLQGKRYLENKKRKNE